MLPSTRYLAETPDSSGFCSFLDELSGELRLDGVLLSDGIYELQTEGGVVQLALAKSRNFAAFSWLKTTVTGVDSCEAFFIGLRDGSGRVGIRQNHRHGTGASCPPSWLSAWLTRYAAVPADKPVPTFISLAATLASNGNFSESQGVPYWREQAQRHYDDSQYQRQLLAEQSENISLLKAKLHQQQTRLPAPALELEPLPGHLTTADLTNLADWCARHEERIVVLPRARNGAKKSRYEHPSLIMQGLGLLAGAYRDYRMGALSLAEFNAQMLPTGLRWAGSVSPTVAGEYGDDYFVKWGGRSCLLDEHLLKGGGRDERFCMRIYFFWDTARQVAVVGSMPAHLSNSLS